MARSARKTARKTPGINAAAWFARQSFHSFMTAPDTGARLDAMLADNRAADLRRLEALDAERAALEAERADDQLVAERDLEREADYRADREGDACTPACGYCGRCS